MMPAIQGLKPESLDWLGWSLPQAASNVENAMTLSSFFMAWEVGLGALQPEVVLESNANYARPAVRLMVQAFGIGLAVVAHQYVAAA